jgi:hypothetical protein
MRTQIAVGLLMLLCGSAAMARWSPAYENMPPEIKTWFKQQHNSQGQWCCDESDGHPYYGDYSINSDGSITLEKDGSARTIPAYMVLKGPNPTGHSVWWYIETGGQHRDYCFAPGTLM